MNVKWGFPIVRLILAFISTTAFFLSSGYVEDFYTRDQNEIDLKLLYENDVDKVIVARSLSSPLLQKEHQVIEKHLGKENVTNAFGNIDDNFLDVSKNVPVQRDQFKKFGLLEIPENNNYLKLVPDKRLENVASSLPKNGNEIALTSYQADCYMKYGYRDNDNQTVKLNSLDDLIGKKLERFTIVGIFENPSFKEGGVSKDYIVKKYGKEETYVNENLPNYNPLEGYFIIGNNVYSSFNESNMKNEYMGTSDGVYITLPKDENESLKLLNELNKEKEKDLSDISFYTPYLSISRKGQYLMGITDPITALIFPQSILLNRSLSIVLMVVFSILSLVFYPLSIQKERQNWNQTKSWKYYLFSSLILIGGSLLLSGVGLWTMFHILNEQLGCLFFMINPWFVLAYIGQAILLSLVGIGTSLLMDKFKENGIIHKSISHQEELSIYSHGDDAFPQQGATS